MSFYRNFCLSVLGLLLSLSTCANSSNVELEVWANEAIIATFTYNHENFLNRQKEIARYFTADGWIAYTKALQTSKLPESVKKNAYAVSAVATLPPTITTLKNQTWKAVMPVLVLYKNPQYRQKQTLTITIEFQKAPSGTGVRGFAIKRLDSKISKPPCPCAKQETVKALA